jgi:uncharacterized protein YacL
MAKSTENIEQVVITRRPRYVRFLVLGFLVGLIVAMIATFAFPNSSQYSTLQIFGFLLLCSLVVFGALGLVAALIFANFYEKRSVTTEAVHEVEKD